MQFLTKPLNENEAHLIAQCKAITGTANNLFGSLFKSPIFQKINVLLQLINQGTSEEVDTLLQQYKVQRQVTPFFKNALLSQDFKLLSKEYKFYSTETPKISNIKKLLGFAQKINSKNISQQCMDLIDDLGVLFSSEKNNYPIALGFTSMLLEFSDEYKDIIEEASQLLFITNQYHSYAGTFSNKEALSFKNTICSIFNKKSKDIPPLTDFNEKYRDFETSEALSFRLNSFQKARLIVFSNFKNADFGTTIPLNHFYENYATFSSYVSDKGFSFVTDNTNYIVVNTDADFIEKNWSSFNSRLMGNLGLKEENNQFAQIITDYSTLAKYMEHSVIQGEPSLNKASFFTLQGRVVFISSILKNSKGKGLTLQYVLPSNDEKTTNYGTPSSYGFYLKTLNFNSFKELSEALQPANPAQIAAVLNQVSRLMIFSIMDKQTQRLQHFGALL